MKKRIVTGILAIILSASLIGCAGSGTTASSTAVSTETSESASSSETVSEESASVSADTEEAIAKVPKEISSDKIGLATNGASISEVTYVAADEDGNKNGAYYKVTGAIHPVDKEAGEINFQINLPENWNGRLAQFGGDGFNGHVVTADGACVGLGEDEPTPLYNGYVTFGSDSGHQALTWKATWALNDESLKNFACEQVKKTRDVAYEVAKSFYEKDPEEVYFVGGSNGGREALMAAQRYPEDYDGIICMYPVLNWVAKAVKDNENGQIMQADDGKNFISNEDYRKALKVIYEIGDGLDGAEDGVIADPLALDAKKDEVFEALKDVLTDDQIEGLKAYYKDKKFDFALADGLDVLPGYSLSQILSDDLYKQFPTDASKRDGVMEEFSDNLLKYMVVRDEDMDPATFNADEHIEELQEASALLNATDPDLSEFKAHGGKMILMHGTADQLVTMYGTIDYYNNVVKTMGQDAADEFLRFYIIPGMGHGTGEAFTMSRDLLSDLDNWVTNGEAPDVLVVKDVNEATYGRTMPLYQYPYYPEYTGNGDVNSADNYKKAKSVTE